MKQKDINKLLADYLSNSISESDFLEMRGLVNQLTDDELAAYVQKAWMEQNTYDNVFEPKTSLLLPRIMKEVKLPSPPITKGKTRMFNLWLKLGKYAAVVSVVILSAITFYLYQEHSSLQAMLAQEVVFSSPAGQRANLVLPDGTEVNLNSLSTLRYKQDFGKESRELSFSGEGFFKVAKDENRPFIIHSNELQIRVLGTTFNFYNYDSDEYAEVALVEGCVQVNTNDNQVVRLMPNEKVTFEKKNKKLIKTHTSLNTELAWKKSELVFEETPLREVIKTIERCYHVHIISEEGKWLDDCYSATYKDVSLDEILEILKIHYKFNIDKNMETRSIHLTFRKQ